jgi:CRP-like cAMP-binding protein
VVVSGRFEVYRRSGSASVPLATVAPGECFGEIGLITHRPRSASVRALEDGVAIRFTQQGVFSRPQAAMQLLRNMADMLVTRLLEADQEIIVLRTGQTPV